MYLLNDNDLTCGPASKSVFSRMVLVWPRCSPPGMLPSPHTASCSSASLSTFSCTVQMFRTSELCWHSSAAVVAGYLGTNWGDPQLWAVTLTPRLRYHAVVVLTTNQRLALHSLKISFTIFQLSTNQRLALFLFNQSEISFICLTNHRLILVVQPFVLVD